MNKKKEFWLEKNNITVSSASDFSGRANESNSNCSIEGRMPAF